MNYVSFVSKSKAKKLIEGIVEGWPTTNQLPYHLQRLAKMLLAAPKVAGLEKLSDGSLMISDTGEIVYDTDRGGGWQTLALQDYYDHGKWYH